MCPKLSWSAQKASVVIAVVHSSCLLTCFPHTFSTSSDLRVPCPTSLPLSVTCVIKKDNYSFLKLTACFFATHSWTSPPSIPKHTLHSFHTVIRRTCGLTAEAVIRKGGSNCAAAGERKLPATQILTFFCIVFGLNYQTLIPVVNKLLQFGLS